MTKQVIVRSGWDRLRYAIVFEAILVISLGAVIALLTDRPLLDTGALSLVLSTIALIVNLIYNTIFDRVDVFYGRVPTERSRNWRILHATGFEFVLVILCLPVIMWWLDWNILQALAFDVSAMAGIVVYTYFFTLTYDRIFPIPQNA